MISKFLHGNKFNYSENIVLDIEMLHQRDSQPKYCKNKSSLGFCGQKLNSLVLSDNSQKKQLLLALFDRESSILVALELEL